MNEPEGAESIPCCAATIGGTGEGILSQPLPGIPDEEGITVPEGLPTVVDAHVHLFPPAVFEALWRWFRTHGWPVRYPLPAEEVLSFLQSRGVQRVVGLQYPHKMGMARGLNDWMARLQHDHAGLHGLASVLPGEPEAATILNEAFEAGLQGVKLHCHVQTFAVDDPKMWPLYEVCGRWNRPLLIHAGREPKSPAYPVDPYSLCHVARMDRVLSEFPSVRFCVPHLGADEFEGYGELMLRHENLWLDTTMMLAGYFPLEVERAWRLLLIRPDRVLYGSDFPNLPYSWDRELRAIAQRALPKANLNRLLWENADQLYGISQPTQVNA
jgi:predicted TIM-barrel fold metal-dependent hydrolase